MVTAIAEARPTVMVSAPRLYEKVHAAIHARVEAAPPLRRRLFAWAVGVGHRWWTAHYAGTRPGAGLRLQHALADRLVLRRIRDAVGGPKNFFSSGGAALSSDVEEFFLSVGLLICQGYGLTETAPMLTCNAPGAFRFGTVGRPIDGVEIRISDEGEIQARGPNVTEGYYRKPEATAESFTDDGWFRTGDIGRLDPDGYLVITDRIKDLIITSSGKNVAPQRIEAIVGKDHYIDQLAVIGDRRSTIAAIVVPAFESLLEFAREKKLAFADHEELIRLPEVLELYRRRIREQSLQPGALREDPPLQPGRPAVLHAGGRDHADAEGAAQGDRREVPRADRAHVRRARTAGAGHALDVVAQHQLPRVGVEVGLLAHVGHLVQLDVVAQQGHGHHQRHQARAVVLDQRQRCAASPCPRPPS